MIRQRLPHFLSGPVAPSAGDRARPGRAPVTSGPRCARRPVSRPRALRDDVTPPGCTEISFSERALVPAQADARAGPAGLHWKNSRTSYYLAGLHLPEAGSWPRAPRKPARTPLGPAAAVPGSAGSAGLTRRPSATRTSPRCPGSRSIPVYGPPDGAVVPGIERIGWPGEFPFTRGLHATGYRGKPWTIRQFSGFGNAQPDQRAVQDAAAGRRRGPVRGLRHADPDGPRLRRPALARRGGALRRGHRLGRRHGRAVRGHPAGRHHHLDDDQRPGRAGLLHVPGRRRTPGRRPVQAGRHPADRHLQGVHRAEGVAVPAAAAPAADR